MASIVDALDVNGSETIEFVEFMAFAENGYARAILKAELGYAETWI